MAIDNSKLRKNLIPDNLKIFGLISLSLKYTDIFKTADFEQKKCQQSRELTMYILKPSRPRHAGGKVLYVSANV